MNRYLNEQHLLNQRESMGVFTNQNPNMKLSKVQKVERVYPEGKIAPWQHQQFEEEQQQQQQAQSSPQSQLDKISKRPEFSIMKYLRARENRIERKSSLPKINQLQFKDKDDPIETKPHKYYTIDNQQQEPRHKGYMRIVSPLSRKDNLQLIQRRHRTNELNLPALSKIQEKIMLKGRQCQKPRANSSVYQRQTSERSNNNNICDSRSPLYLQNERQTSMTYVKEITPLRLENVQGRSESKKQMSQWLARRKEDVLIKVYEQIRNSYGF